MLFRIAPFIKKTLEFKRTVPKLKTVVKITTGITIGTEVLLHVDTKDVAPGIVSRSQIVLPSEEKLALSKTSQEKFESYGRIAIQAAQNMGVTNPAFITFYDDSIDAQISKKSTLFTPLPTGMNAHCGSFFSRFPKRGPRINISYDAVKKLTPEEMYAIAGHEVLHAQENHIMAAYLMYPTYALSKYMLKQLAPKIYFKYPMLASAWLTINLHNLFAQHVLETRADSISAEKLGSAKKLSSALVKMEQDTNAQMNFYFDNIKSIDYFFLLSMVILSSLIVSDHFSTAKRVSNLDKIQSQPDYVDALSFFAIKIDPNIEITQERNFKMQ